MFTRGQAPCVAIWQGDMPLAKYAPTPARLLALANTPRIGLVKLALIIESFPIKSFGGSHVPKDLVNNSGRIHSVFRL